jgi:hypothetical protein
VPKPGLIGKVSSFAQCLSRCQKERCVYDLLDRHLMCMLTLHSTTAALPWTGQHSGTIVASVNAGCGGRRGKASPAPAQTPRCAAIPSHSPWRPPSVNAASAGGCQRKDRKDVPATDRASAPSPATVFRRNLTMIAPLGLTTLQLTGLALGCLFCLALVTSIVALLVRSWALPVSRGKGPFASPRSDARRGHCPHCLSSKLRPSRFRGLEWLLGAFLFRPYRCLSCYGRFWRFRLLPGNERPPASPQLPLSTGRASPLGRSEEKQLPNQASPVTPP